MDHSIRPEVDMCLTAAAVAISSYDDETVRRHLVQEFLDRLNFRAVVVLPPAQLAPHAIPVVYKAMAAVFEVIMHGGDKLASISVSAHAGRGVTFPDAPPGVDQPEFRRDIEVVPDGVAFNASMIGPFSFHLPRWVDPQMTCEISGMLWRVLRFILKGYEGCDERFVELARIALTKSGREALVNQYMATGYLRWLFDTAGIKTFDIYGNEVDDTPEFFYGHLFDEKQRMPDEYEAQARYVESVPGAVDG